MLSVGVAVGEPAVGTALPGCGVVVIVFLSSAFPAAECDLNVLVGAAISVEAIEVRSKYLEHLYGLLDKDIHMDDMRVVIDCANGATTTIAPEVFKKLGLDVTYIGCQPDGCNINLRCGSTATELLAHTVVKGHYELGIAYDGDGDRAIFVDSQGQVVNGDAVMLICA